MRFGLGFLDRVGEVLDDLASRGRQALGKGLDHGVDASLDLGPDVGEPLDDGEHVGAKVLRLLVVAAVEVKANVVGLLGRHGGEPDGSVAGVGEDGSEFLDIEGGGFEHASHCTQIC